MDDIKTLEWAEFVADKTLRMGFFRFLEKRRLFCVRTLPLAQGAVWLMVTTDHANPGWVKMSGPKTGGLEMEPLVHNVKPDFRDERTELLAGAWLLHEVSQRLGPNAEVSIKRTAAGCAIEVVDRAKDGTRAGSWPTSRATLVEAVIVTLAQLGVQEGQVAAAEPKAE